MGRATSRRDGAFGLADEGGVDGFLGEEAEVTHIDVDEGGACPVKDKDVDERTVASLAARGIETFTPVQASRRRP